MHITRPAPVAHLHIDREQMITVEVRDHDGTPLTILTKRAWSSAGVATVEIATSPRPVHVEAGVAFVKLFFAELGGMRLRSESMRWLGIA